MVTRRITAMNGRRELILNTAARLLIDAPETFSMRNLAVAACVSIRTIYNLVGDQSQVLTAVLNRPVHGLLEQLRRERRGAAFNGLILEARLIKRMDLAGEAGLAAVRALQRLEPAGIERQVRTLIEAEYVPDLRLAVAQGDLRNDVPISVLTENLIAVVTQAVSAWSVDADSKAYQGRVIRALATTLLIAAVEGNRRRCLNLLRYCNR
jgi:AcrR family transcriptional regulator